MFWVHPATDEAIIRRHVELSAFRAIGITEIGKYK